MVNAPHDGDPSEDRKPLISSNGILRRRPDALLSQPQMMMPVQQPQKRRVTFNEEHMPATPGTEPPKSPPAVPMSMEFARNARSTSPELLELDLDTEISTRITLKPTPDFSGPSFRVFGTISKEEGQPLGLQLYTPVNPDNKVLPCTVIASLKPNSVAAKAGYLRAGDRISDINGCNVETSSHESVIKLLAMAKGMIRLTVNRLLQPDDTEDVSGISNDSIMAIGSGRIPSKQDSLKQRIRPVAPVDKAHNVVLHRHPNTRGLLIWIRAGLPEDRFPVIEYDPRMRSPIAPLVEGGEINFGDELLEIDGVVVVGRSNEAILDILRASGEETVLRVVRSANRTISGILQYTGKDPETRRLSIATRQLMYQTIRPLCTRKPGKDEAKSYEYVTESRLRLMAENGEILDWMQLRSGNFYAIPRTVLSSPQAGKQSSINESIEDLLTALGQGPEIRSTKKGSPKFSRTSPKLSRTSPKLSPRKESQDVIAVQPAAEARRSTITIARMHQQKLEDEHEEKEVDTRRVFKTSLPPRQSEI
eukprot:m.340492 g.340492  ORF g.340492 m.340492 type:complete len:534 (-) comp19329_c0_seq1:1541-3142(-)